MTTRPSDYNNGTRTVMLVAALLLVSAPASAQELYDGSPATAGSNSHQVLTTGGAGIECRLTTFEGGGNFQEIHPEAGNSIAGSGMRFPGWRTLTSGPFANNPSGVTIALMTAAAHEIFFDEPVSTVSFFYASVNAVILDVFDAAGIKVASVTRSGNIQPDGFTLWESLGVSVSVDIITRVAVTGSTFQTAIDDPSNCRGATPAQLVSSLINDVITLDLRTGISTSLDAKLDMVLMVLDDLNANNDVAAVHSLNAFINAVGAQSGNGISVEDADALIAQANAILALL